MGKVNDEFEHRRISIDVETTALPKEVKGTIPYITEIGFVPFDILTGRVYIENSFRILLRCPDIKTMKEEGTVSQWNLDRKESLETMEKASREGMFLESAKEEILNYLASVRNIVGERPIIFGKSLSALDTPMLYRTFGDSFIDRNFSHQHECLTSHMRGFKRLGYVESLSLEKEAMRLLGVEIPHTSVEDACIAAELFIHLEHKKLNHMKQLDDIIKQLALTSSGF